MRREAQQIAPGRYSCKGHIIQKHMMFNRHKGKEVFSHWSIEEFRMINKSLGELMKWCYDNPKPKQGKRMYLTLDRTGKKRNVLRYAFGKHKNIVVDSNKGYMNWLLDQPWFPKSEKERILDFVARKKADLDEINRLYDAQPLSDKFCSAHDTNSYNRGEHRSVTRSIALRRKNKPGLITYQNIMTREWQWS